MSSRVPLVIDTDTAADDCFALLVGLLHPQADLLAVTMVAGNVGFDQQVHNALLTLELAGRIGEVPVHLGARRPLTREWRSASEVHGDGVGGLRRADSGHTVSDEHAADALVRLARERPGEVTVVAIGPLTNIALALQRDPEFARNVKTLTIMGGSINGRGNITPAAEYNIYVDPEAAQIVFDAGFADILIVPWDPTTLRDLVFDGEKVASIGAQGNLLSRFFVQANQATFDFDLRAGIAGSTHPDSLSVLVSIDPSFALATGRYRVDVETAGHLTRGATIFDWRPESTPNARAVEAVDAVRFHTFLKDLLATEPVDAIAPHGLAAAR